MKLIKIYCEPFNFQSFRFKKNPNFILFSWNPEELKSLKFANHHLGSLTVWYGSSSTKARFAIDKFLTSNVPWNLELLEVMESFGLKAFEFEYIITYIILEILKVLNCNIDIILILKLEVFFNLAYWELGSIKFSKN